MYLPWHPVYQREAEKSILYKLILGLLSFPSILQVRWFVVGKPFIARQPTLERAMNRTTTNTFACSRETIYSLRVHTRNRKSKLLSHIHEKLDLKL